MQLPFLRRLLPDVPIVPLLMGFQRRETIVGARATRWPQRCGIAASLLVASTDLSHYFDADDRAARSTGGSQALVAAFDPDGLLDLFESIRSTSAAATSPAAAARRSR